MPVSHLTMNGITSLNYPQVAFESWSLPVPGRKTLSLTCAGFVLFHRVLPSKWKLLLHYFYCLPCFQKQLEAALFENKHFLFTKRLYSGESIKLKYVGLVAGCIYRTIQNFQHPIHYLSFALASPEMAGIMGSLWHSAVDSLAG